MTLEIREFNPGGVNLCDLVSKEYESVEYVDGYQCAYCDVEDEQVEGKGIKVKHYDSHKKYIMFNLCRHQGAKNEIFNDVNIHINKSFDKVLKTILIVERHGTAINNGHYTVKINKNEIFYQYNDKLIKTISEAEFRNSSESTFIICEIMEPNFKLLIENKCDFFNESLQFTVK